MKVPDYNRYSLPPDFVLPVGVQEEKKAVATTTVNKLPDQASTATQQRDKPSSSSGISKGIGEFFKSSLKPNSDRREGKAGIALPACLLTVGPEIKEMAKSAMASMGQKMNSVDVQVGVIVSSCVSLLKREDASKVLQTALQQLDTELAALEKKYPKFPDPNVFILDKDKEKFVFLRSLKEQAAKNPEYFEKIIEDHGKSSLCKHLQPLKFLSMAAKSDEYCREYTGEIALKVTDKKGKETFFRERIALFGYTTSDYKAMNTACREAGSKSIKDPGVRAYVKYCDSAMKNLPDAELPKNEKGEAIPLRRAIFPPISSDWIKEKFKEGETFVDYGFASTSIKEEAVAGGAVIMTFEPPEGSTTMPHAKSLGPPYTAWPGEGEITFERGTKFDIVSVTPPKAEGGPTHVTLRVIP